MMPAPVSGPCHPMARHHAVAMSDTTSPWDKLRRLRDELKLEIHLAGMEAREKWDALQPRLDKLQEKVIAASDRAEHYVDEEVTSLGKALHDLRADLKKK